MSPWRVAAGLAALVSGVCAPIAIGDGPATQPAVAAALETVPDGATTFVAVAPCRVADTLDAKSSRLRTMCR